MSGFNHSYSLVHPLILVRHAEADHHVQAITGGWTNSHLTKRGLQQVRLTAERLQQELSQELPVQVVTSPLSRAVQTAGPIAKALGALPLIEHPALTDLNNGVAAGKTHAEARELAFPISDPVCDWQPYPEAETWRQFFQRVSDFLEDFTPQQTGPVLIVSHAATIHTIVAWWLGISVESRTFFDLAPASISVLRVNRWNEHALERINDTQHLAAAGMPNPIRLRPG